MEEITSIKQIEEMEDKEIEARMEEICSKYVQVVDSIFVEGIPGYTPASIIPAWADLTVLSEADDLPPFTLEFILNYLYELNNGLVSKVQEKYSLKYYELLLAMAKNPMATGKLLQEIAEEMSYLSSEGFDVDDTQYGVAMAVLSHKNCLSETFDHLEEFAFFCRVNGFNCEGEDAITLITESHKTPIETLRRIRHNQVEKYGEQPEAEEGADECYLTVAQAVDRNLRGRKEEIIKYYDDPNQLKLFDSL